MLAKRLLTQHSVFFNDALNGRFAESSSRSMTMPEDSPETFRIFVQWLYLGDIKTDDIGAWLEAWIFGNKIGSTEFKNCVTTRLVRGYTYTGCVILPTTVATAYLKSVPGSELRQWALDGFLYRSNHGHLHYEAENLVSLVENETEFVADVIKAMILFTGGEVKNPAAHSSDYLG